MKSTLDLRERPAVMPDTGPNLLIEWSSPWQEFVSALGPALRRSPARLAGEARSGLVPVRGMLLTWGTQAIFIAAFLWLSAHLPSMQPFIPRTPPKVEVIYFSADELPPVADRGGAQAGKSGRAGGKEVHHRSQAIRVARGSEAREKVVDAPNLKLPVSSGAVANLLAFKSNPGPPPAEGLKSSRTAPALSKDALVAPPPEVQRDPSRGAPNLASSVIAPPPTPQRVRQTMGMSTTIIAPAPQDVPRDQSHSVIAMNSPIIEPAPDVHRDPPPLRGPAAASTTVVPPPVSAAPRDPASAPKLSLPTPGVIAPPPSQVTRDLRTSGAGLTDPKVVPPPVQLGGRSNDKHAIQGLVGTNQVVPPPPGDTNGTSLSGGGRGQANKPGGFGTTLTADNVVPPPPGVSGGTSLSGSGGRGLGSSLAPNVVVPPPPSLSGAGGALSSRGSGSKGAGQGGPLDLGSAVAAPPTSGGSNASGTGVVVSSQPGSVKGLPGNGATGATAMSPAGNATTGVGGSGGGSGIGRGNGPGSGLTGEGTGAAKAGVGRGSDPNARGGISPYPGTGGAGSGTGGQPTVPGVSVSGGSAIITIPSFGSGGNDPSVIPGRSGAGKEGGEFDITVEASPGAGGALARYRQLKGEKVYTKYIHTGDGRVVMQLVGPNDLTSPRPLRTVLPPGLTHGVSLEIACVLDRSGTLQNMHVLKADDGAPTAKVIAALYSWKFVPALRGTQPIEVNAILGFNINTN